MAARVEYASRTAAPCCVMDSAGHMRFDGYDLADLIPSPRVALGSGMRIVEKVFAFCGASKETEFSEYEELVFESEPSNFTDDRFLRIVAVLSALFATMTASFGAVGAAVGAFDVATVFTAGTEVTSRTGGG